MPGSKESSDIHIARFIRHMDELVRSRYDAQLQVEVDDVSYTVYARDKLGDRVCVGCGVALSDRIEDVHMLNQGPVPGRILLIVQCERCNDALTK